MVNCWNSLIFFFFFLLLLFSRFERIWLLIVRCYFYIKFRPLTLPPQKLILTFNLGESRAKPFIGKL